ncbi:tetratricopeptide repeat protein [Tamlana crocina]|uniref:Tetratricopeptide repeat protein n=1 Tax=Tamlana crocina TaxID=393006 RepID=A0ABX1DAE8_9FLAO|nr:tetratricopeptide repeat protein [Tamlana crocina]NJX15326.1 tetratricopeptide repeat protein [Tamlana crocina]
MSFKKRCSLICFGLLFITINYAQESNSTRQVETLSVLKEQLKIAENHIDSSKIKQVHAELGDFYKHLGLYSEALNNFHLSQQYSAKKDTFFVYTNNSIAAINFSLKKFEEANKYLKESIEVSKTIQYDKGLATAFALSGSVAEKQGDYKRALQNQEQSLSLFEKQQDSTGLAIAYENIGSIHEDLERYALADTYFNKAFHYAKNSPMHVRINIINNLGDINRKTGNFESALHFTEQALQMARDAKNGSEEESALKDLARTYAAMGDFEKAYEFMNNQAIVNEQEIKRHNAELVSAMEVLYEVKEREAQVNVLNKQNQIAKTRQWAILLIGFAMLLVLAVWMVYIKKRKKQELQIFQYKQQLLKADLDKKTAEETSLKREIDFKIASLTNYSLNIAHKNKMLADVSRTLNNLKSRNGDFIKNKLGDLASEIDVKLSNENEWEELMGFFSQIHPKFFEILKTNALEKLSPSELRLCMLLRLNLSSKEIASILCITPDSVRIARYRLRKKLPLDSNDDLQGYLLNL